MMVHSSSPTYACRAAVRYGRSCCQTPQVFADEARTLDTLAAGITIVSECITIVLTWMKTIPAVRLLRHNNLGTVTTLPVSCIILHDGEVLSHFFQYYLFIKYSVDLY